MSAASAQAKVRQRVQRLVALATHNPNQHEAQLAAVEACRILDAEPWLLETTAPVEQVPEGPPEPEPVRSYRITSKFRNKCKVCGEMFDVGTDVWWHPGTGCAHIACASPTGVW